ncbi:unnamed protein product, partial [Rotaria magnacalcarata]
VNYAITIVNNLTCKLYNAFLYGFTSTFCWKDDIKDFTGAELSDDMHSFDDSYEKNTMNILNTSVNGSEKAVNNLTCKLYNAFLYGFTSTFCWKDDIKDFKNYSHIPWLQQ